MDWLLAGICLELARVCPGFGACSATDVAARGYGIHIFRPGEVCAVMTVDSFPVLFCDCAGREVASAHIGCWGLCAYMLEQTLAVF